MTGEPGATGAPRPLTDEHAQGQDVLGLGERERDALLAWVGENLTLVRRSASGQRILYWSLGSCFVVVWPLTSAASSSNPGRRQSRCRCWATCSIRSAGHYGPGVVVVVFTQLHPETKKR